MPPDTAAQKACSYILNRIQTDPDLRYYAGPMTETFHLLCVAQAEYTGEPLAEVEKQRRKDLQPDYRWREPEVLALKTELQSLRDLMANVGVSGVTAKLTVQLADALEAVRREVFAHLSGALLDKTQAVREQVMDALIAAGRLS